MESPGSHTYDLNIHEYLHSIVNRMVRANYDKQAGKLRAYYRAGKKTPIADPYREQIGFASECMIRALDHRMRFNLAADPAERKRMEDLNAKETAAGLTLVRPLYKLLAEYEKSNLDFSAYLPIMFDRLPKHMP